MFAIRVEPYMTLSIRNPEADALAKRLAKLDDTTITEAVIVALKEAIAARTHRESPTETARRLLARRGLSFPANRQPVPPEAYHELDHDLSEGR
jgi:antitoxin VapB